MPPSGLYPALIAERLVRFDREISLLGARAGDGRTVFYPLVENQHAEGMLRCSVAPAPGAEVLQRRAEAMLRAIMEDCGYVGVMAMELFDAGGQLLVNELAPRVHNSGHWSQAGCLCDQFEQHLRAVCGWPLADPGGLGVTAMLNLVGTPFDEAWLAHHGVQLHWYGKEARAARKLGHMNAHAVDASALHERLETLAGALDPAHRAALQSVAAVLGRFRPARLHEAS